MVLLERASDVVESSEVFDRLDELTEVVDSEEEDEFAEDVAEKDERLPCGFEDPTPDMTLP
jgi:hypothetical protein